MTDPTHEFGDRLAGVTYQLRPGGYAVIRNADGEIAMVRTPVGAFLPGGGQEPGETLEAAAIREVHEECGLHVRILATLGVADELVFVTEDDMHYRKRCTFFLAEVVGQGAAIEPDHELIWYAAEEANNNLKYESQRWALGRARIHPNTARS